jgi:hypothetical protein
MFTVNRIRGGIFDHDRCSVIADLATDRRRNLKLAAWPQTEIHLVEDCAGDPFVARYLCDDNKSHLRQVRDSL